MPFRYVKDTNGTHQPLAYITAHEAVKAGDALTLYVSGQNQTDLTDDAAEYVLGVAAHDAAAAATLAYYPATDSAIFEAVTATTNYIDATYRFQTCDLGAFTSGAMTINPGSDVNHQVRMLGLADGETDNSSGNKCYIKFNLRQGWGA